MQILTLHVNVATGPNQLYYCKVDQILILLVFVKVLKHRPSNAGKTALEWQAAQFDSGDVDSINFSSWVQKTSANNRI